MKDKKTDPKTFAIPCAVCGKSIPQNRAVNLFRYGDKIKVFHIGCNGSVLVNKNKKL